MIQIRIRESEDHEQILELDRVVFAHDERIDPHKGTWWLAEALVEGSWEPVGFAGAELNQGVFLCRAGVISTARGAGIHRRLIRARVAWARRQGFYRAWTYTWWGNTRSQASLVREGFVPYKYEVVEDGKLGIRFLYFQLRLLTQPALEV